MTKANIPQSVKISLISQLIMLVVAILFEFTLFFTNLYEIYSPQICTISFTGKERCLNYDGQYETFTVECQDCQFLHLIWPLSLAEITLLMCIFICKIYYFFTLKCGTIIKVISIVLIAVILSLEIYLLLQFDSNIPQVLTFNYTIKLYPIVTKLLIGVLILSIIIAIWVEDIQTLKYKKQQSIASSSSCYSQQLLQIQ
ncbi:unnamed protein product (macronuclear) [Paramecium tetraurelia]|uniref:Transmembrane protein n=1 Tax=Paramecium tetraurelia TaxID=5888 RepID=A0BQS9_PARTE|nr:uncharacterized protein GSPATT00031125001 [Paramecium tetraurelia]CAK60896.1 unnamed protein product [Paramecium tetraurelia]|eukprot:XP_001428294.1 hypothetical protein (macronuclear) [Paramecium tetraurelia strain d4-2]